MTKKDKGFRCMSCNKMTGRENENTIDLSDDCSVCVCEKCYDIITHYEALKSNEQKWQNELPKEVAHAVLLYREGLMTEREMLQTVQNLNLI